MSIPKNIRLSELFENECVNLPNGDRVPQHAASEFYGMECANQEPEAVNIAANGTFTLNSPRCDQLRIQFQDSQSLGVGNGVYEWGFSAYLVNQANRILIAQNIKPSSFTYILDVGGGEFTIDKIIYKNGSEILREPSFLFQTVSACCCIELVDGSCLLSVNRSSLDLEICR